MNWQVRYRVDSGYVLNLSPIILEIEREDIRFDVKLTDLIRLGAGTGTALQEVRRIEVFLKQTDGRAQQRVP